MLILSISMCIHIINNYRLNINQNNFSERLNFTIKKMFWPCLYTVLTTIVAFGSLLFSDIKPVIDSTFRFEDLPGALNYMKKGNHVGKIVLDFD